MSAKKFRKKPNSQRKFRSHAVPDDYLDGIEEDQYELFFDEECLDDEIRPVRRKRRDKKKRPPLPIEDALDDFDDEDDDDPLKTAHKRKMKGKNHRQPTSRYEDFYAHPPASKKRKKKRPFHDIDDEDDDFDF